MDSPVKDDSMVDERYDASESLLALQNSHIRYSPPIQMEHNYAAEVNTIEAEAALVLAAFKNKARLHPKLRAKSTQLDVNANCRTPEQPIRNDIATPSTSSPLHTDADTASADEGSLSDERNSMNEAIIEFLENMRYKFKLKDDELPTVEELQNCIPRYGYIKRKGALIKIRPDVLRKSPDSTFHSPEQPGEDNEMSGISEIAMDVSEAEQPETPKKKVKLTSPETNNSAKAFSIAKNMVPIGEGNALVPASLIKHMSWTSYTAATRKLLTSVFSRSVLATHSLTGKSSPAFPNKKAKKRLNPALVNDIVMTVVEKCNVPENIVRTCITTKCADESKMLRMRQKHKKSSKCENTPPSDEDDSE